MPTAQYTVYMPYVIYFHDKSEYEFAVISCGGTTESGGEFDGSPDHAAAFFDIPIPWPSGNMDNIPKGIYIIPPYFDGVNLNALFAPPNVIMNNVTDEYLVPGRPGSGGFPLPNGSNVNYRWRGTILYMAAGQSDDPIPVSIPQRRWIGGFEIPLGEGGDSTAYGFCRDSSRTLDGLGFPLRGLNTNGARWSRSPAEYSGVGVYQSWERLYFRPRVNPTGPTAFWRCHATSSSAAGAMLVYTSSGCISLYTVSAVGATTLKYTSPVLDPYTWFRLDMVFEFPPTFIDNGGFMLYINGVYQFSYVDTSNADMDTTGYHSSSEIGKGCGFGAFGDSDPTAEYDLDDWINSAWPTDGVSLSLENPDWFMGSHVRKAFAVSGYAGAFTPAAPLMMNQASHPAPSYFDADIQTTLSGANVYGLADLPQLGVQDKMGEVSLGAVASMVCVNSQCGGAGGSLGYDVAGTGAVMSTLVEVNVSRPYSKMYRPSGLMEPAEITPFQVRYQKGPTSDNTIVRYLQSVHEYIGIWGVEDVEDPSLYPDERPRINNLHNCSYSNMPFGYMGPTLDCPVYIKGGTYSGNGTYQVISLPSAVHMIFIRPLTGGTQGVMWFAAGLGGHSGTTDAYKPNHINHVWFDPDLGTFQFSVTGQDANSNAPGITYQYIAFCDPGMRFSCAGAYNTPYTVVSRNNLLQNPGFTPEFTFIQFETSAASSLLGLHCKSSANPGTEASKMDSGGTLINDFCSFSQGAITTGINAHRINGFQTNYLAIRGVEDCAFIMFQIFTYTGDGTGNRDIPMTPTTTRYPLYVLVIPHGGSGAVFRDPSHTGFNSSAFDGLGTTTTGIRSGGMDTINVGASLNALGVVYTVFAIPGSASSWSNGTFYPPNCQEIEPWFNPPIILPDIVVKGEGGLTLGGSTPTTLLRDISGIYTLVTDKRNDTLIDRQTGVASVEIKIPDPFIKTGYIGG